MQEEGAAVDDELHIPVSVRRNEDSQWRALCSCKSWGPLATGPNEAKEALAEAHEAQEPASGCALCGLVVPAGARGGTHFRHPWQRYEAIPAPTERWEYVCRDSAGCRQRCLAREQGVVAGESWMVFDATGEDFEVSLDDKVGDVVFELERSIAMYRLAQDASPRGWDSITSSAIDQRALAARVVALSALEETARAWQPYAVLCARRAGVSWGHLAALLEDSAEDLLAETERWYSTSDWPWHHENTPPDVAETLKADPNT